MASTPCGHIWKYTLSTMAIAAASWPTKFASAKLVNNIRFTITAGGMNRRGKRCLIGRPGRSTISSTAPAAAMANGVCPAHCPPTNPAITDSNDDAVAVVCNPKPTAATHSPPPNTSASKQPLAPTSPSWRRKVAVGMGSRPSGLALMRGNSTPVVGNRCRVRACWSWIRIASSSSMGTTASRRILWLRWRK